MSSSIERYANENEVGPLNQKNGCSKVTNKLWKSKIPEFIFNESLAQ